MQQLAINSGIDTSVNDDEQKTIMEEGNTWTSWLKKNRTILIVAGVITIGGLLVLYQKMNKQDIPTGGSGGSGASSGGASSSSLSSFAKQLEDNIIVKSIIEALNNFGEVAPPCPHDPVTGLPNFDAWEELLGLAIKVAAGER